MDKATPGEGPMSDDRERIRRLTERVSCAG
jgi:hypothetical protein